jgi:hypothetical protein
MHVDDYSIELKEFEIFVKSMYSHTRVHQNSVPA